MPSSPPRVALVSARDLPFADEESKALVPRLAAHGVSACLAAWDDPTIEWGGFDLAVVRSTWNYTEDLPAFLGWIDHVEAQTTLANPASVTRWNHHKRYLAQLAAAGVPVVPTTLVETGGEMPPLHGDLIVKPAVSVGAIDTVHFKGDAPAARAHLERLLTRGSALVQPFCASIADRGERSLIYLEGVLSHAVVKRPAAGDFRVHEHFGGANEPVEPTARDQDLAEAALAHVPHPSPLLYARVDLVDLDGVRGEREGPAVSELELIEPYLYLRDTPDPEAAAERVAGAIARRAHERLG